MQMVGLESDVERASIRSNRIEQKILELNLEILETGKKAAATDMRKVQGDMKKRLRKYRDKQRQIFKDKNTDSDCKFDSFISQQVQQRAMSRVSLSVGRHRSLSSKSRKTDRSEELIIELDPSFFTDQQKSKIDLRPQTSLSLSYKDFSRAQSAFRLDDGVLQKQIRYFDKDELKDREIFYTQLIESRIAHEKGMFQGLNNKVLMFNGSGPPENRKGRLKGLWAAAAASLSEAKKVSTTSRPSSSIGLLLEQETKEPDQVLPRVSKAKSKGLSFAEIYIELCESRDIGKETVKQLKVYSADRKPIYKKKTRFNMKHLVSKDASKKAVVVANQSEVCPV